MLQCAAVKINSLKNLCYQQNNTKSLHVYFMFPSVKVKDVVLPRLSLFAFPYQYIYLDTQYKMNKNNYASCILS